MLTVSVEYERILLFRDESQAGASGVYLDGVAWE